MEGMDLNQRIRIMFDRTYNEKDLTPEEYSNKVKSIPDSNLIANYCKNIVLTSKMEKEVIIISLVYIERLILKSG